MPAPLPPPVKPRSVISASPGPLTTQPMIESVTGSEMCARRFSNSSTVAMTLNPCRAHDGQAMMGEFVETYARTCRKYGGALATATQSLNDYYKSDGATAALENSDWMLILQQKPETIADFKASKRLDMDDRTETLIRSLKRQGNSYSEVFIKGPETETIGRLVLDDYSATLFSSSPQTFAAIDAEIARGHQLADAIERIAFPNHD